MQPSTLKIVKYDSFRKIGFIFVCLFSTRRDVICYFIHYSLKKNLTV